MFDTASQILILFDGNAFSFQFLEMKPQIFV